METLQSFFDLIWLESLQVRIEHWLLTEVLIWSSLAQIAIVVFVAGAALPVARLLGQWLDGLAERTVRWEKRLQRVFALLSSLSYPAVSFGFSILVVGAADSYGFPHHIVTIAASLLGAWLVIRLATSVLANRELARVIGVLAWAIAALNVLGLLDPILVLLESLAIPIGERRVTVLAVIKAFVLLFVLLWLAGALGRFVSARLSHSKTLTPSIKVLAEKSIKIALVVFVVLLTMDYVGIDLTAFAVFTGAVGVGVGFGLQKVISNLISGFILLLDRSIKPGDVIEVGPTFGWVTTLSARYVSLTTRDGREWLIPNEDLITQQVINWSYSNKLLRLPIKFGISYDSDVRLAIQLAVDAALSVSRVHKDPGPVCRLVGFGDSSVDFELRVWISDPEAGVANVTSDVFLALWDRFHQNDIQLPFPQREITIKPESEITVRQDVPADRT